MINPLRISLETYRVLNHETELAGMATVAPPAAGHLRLELIDHLTHAPVWDQTITLDRSNDEIAFKLPVGKFAGGYYRLRGSLTDSSTNAEVGLAIRQSRPVGGQPQPAASDSYLQFARQTVDRILEQQAIRLANKADGTLFVVAGNRFERSYRSIGAKVNGRFQTFWFPESPLELEPARMDVDAWPVLDQLSQLTGHPQYAQHVSDMIAAFGRDGFDAKSGLAYFGEEANFDVRQIKGVPRGGHDAPKFKPSFSGSNATLSIDRLWEIAPDATHRMARAAFWGLVTDPARMDYNRFCYYNFSDADEKHALPPSSGHCAFDSSGAALIHLWASAFAQRGDEQCLQWAQQMADKWQAVQHPQSGLVPNFFGADISQKPHPLPGKWAESRGAAPTAWLWAAAARQLEKRPGGEKLAGQLSTMARRLAQGVIQYAYDPGRRLFIENLNLDGTPYTQTARYCFRTQAEKDAAVAEDPQMAQVFVWDGAGLYRNAIFWDHFAGSNVPLRLAHVADLTGDPQLARLLDPIATAIAEESSRQPEAFTDEGRWTFRATGEYIQLLMILHRLTGNASYVNSARQIADQELARLEQVQWPQWWRLAQRAPLLLGLLSLHEANLEPLERSNP